MYITPIAQLKNYKREELRIINFKPLRYSVNLPTTLCVGITLVDNKHSQITRNQKGNQVNIPTVRTKTSGANSIKSKSVNTWKSNQIKSNQIKSYFLKNTVYN